MYKIVFVLAFMSGSFVGKANGFRAGDFGADGFGAGDSVQIQYGQHGELSYNVKKGTFNVYNDHRPVFSDIAAAVRVNGDLLSSVDYATRSYHTAAVEDRFGKGVKHIFILQGRDKIVHGSIRGHELRSPLIFVGCFDDWRAGLESYGQANSLQEPL